MPIKIGNVEIATVFKGNTELDNLRLGNLQQWVGIIITPDPSIAYVSRTTTSLTFDLTNNHTETVTIYYGTGNPYPNGSTVSVAASATKRVTLSGLADGTSFTISAVALEVDQLPSVGTVSFTQSTATATTAAPSISNVNPAITSVSFKLRNNDDETAVVYYEVNDSTPDIKVTLGPNATTNRTISGLSGGTGYTLYARAKQSNENMSSTVSKSFTTDLPNWSIGTVTYDNVSYYLGSQVGYPIEQIFNANGTKLYIINFSNDRVYQYSLSTAYNLSTTSSDGISFPFGSQDAQPRGLAFNNNGTKLYMIGASGDRVFQYSLSTPYNVGTASYDNKNFGAGGQDSKTTSLAFNNNGTKMYIIGTRSESVYQYSLSTAFDVSTASYDNKKVVFNNQGGDLMALRFNQDGSRFIFLSADNDRLYEYSMSTYFDVSTATYTGNNFYVGSQNSGSVSISLNNTGTKIYMLGANGDTMYQYTNSF